MILGYVVADILLLLHKLNKKACNQRKLCRTYHGHETWGYGARDVGNALWGKSTGQLEIDGYTDRQTSAIHCQNFTQFVLSPHQATHSK